MKKWSCNKCGSKDLVEILEERTATFGKPKTEHLIHRCNDCNSSDLRLEL